MHSACTLLHNIIHSFVHFSQSEVGEGTFVFKASNAGEISQVIDWRIKGVIRSNGSCEDGGNADNSPPPPQVPGVCCIVASICVCCD